MRDQIPSTVRWFMTLSQQDCFKSTLGPISMAAASHTPADASSSGHERSTNASSKERGSREPKEGKEGKKPKEGKPKKAPKPALANGNAAGQTIQRACFLGVDLNPSHNLVRELCERAWLLIPDAESCP